MSDPLLFVDTSESNVTLTGNLHVTENIYAKGIVINTTQYIDTSNRSTTSGSEQTGYTTPWTSMKPKSKVKLDVHIPYRNDGTGWGGSYHTIYMMVNKQVGTLSASTWVSIMTSGYHMVHVQEIISYTNTVLIPLVVNEDFQVRFKHTYRVYNNGTLYINSAHNLNFKNDSDNTQFGMPHPHAGYVKFIVQEISG